MTTSKTVDNLGIDVHISYARRTQLLEEVDKEFGFSQAAIIPAQTAVFDINPKAPALEVLLGSQLSLQQTPWACFTMPERYSDNRSPLFSYDIIPSLYEFVQYVNRYSLRSDAVYESKDSEEDTNNKNSQDQDVESSDEQSNESKQDRSQFLDAISNKAEKPNSRLALSKMQQTGQLLHVLNKNLSFVRSCMAQFLQG
ncbi:MAG: hypothetical protein K0S74_1178 [Chlamydiales bacterium]|jgi:hypothetical protein|nr:hypothetical protein [Chlamydiales bacterium]